MSPTIFSPGTTALKSRFTRSGSARRPLDGGGRPPRPRLAGDQAQLAHELADQLRAGLLAAAGQGGGIRRYP